MGACGDAPVLLVNNKRMCVKMAPPALDALVDELREAAGRGEGAPRRVGAGPDGERVNAPGEFLDYGRTPC